MQKNQESMENHRNIFRRDNPGRRTEMTEMNRKKRKKMELDVGNARAYKEDKQSC